MRKKIFEVMAEMPAVMLDKTLETSEKITNEIIERTQFKRAKKFWHALGPGLTTGAADDDPSGIATYSQAGAQSGFKS